MDSISGLNARSAGQNLSGHVALITGSSRGIGKAIAAKLAELGAAVSLCARNAQVLEKTAAELSAAGAKVRCQALDVTSARDVTTFVQATETELGPVTILVNNAGIGSPGFVDEDRDGAEFRFGGLHERCDVTGAGYVEGLTADFRAGRRQFRGGFFEHLRVASAKTDGCTELCELRGNGFADAAAAAGYE